MSAGRGGGCGEEAGAAHRDEDERAVRVEHGALHEPLGAAEGQLAAAPRQLVHHHGARRALRQRHGHVVAARVPRHLRRALVFTWVAGHTSVHRGRLEKGLNLIIYDA